MDKSLGLVSSTLRSGHAHFVDLPWDVPLADWHDHTDRLVDVAAGPSRHPVVFVGAGGGVFALKEQEPEAAEREYELLGRMTALDLPVVEAVGYAATRTFEGDRSVLITRYLERSLPYHVLFGRTDLSRYRDHLWDAMVNLLVQLHLAGVYWGDCSMFNTLFRRDVGTLQAYLVDAETSEVREELSDGMRGHDVELAGENVFGALLDLQAVGALDANFDAVAAVDYIARRYGELWSEITRTDVFEPSEHWRIEERVRSLNTLGFSVHEIELQRSEAGDRLMVRPVVGDRRFHRSLLRAFTALDAEEEQARLLMNEIQQIKARLSWERGRSVSLTVAGHHWVTEHFEPMTERLKRVVPDEPGVDLYCEVLEHKWLESERAQRDIGLQAAVDGYIDRRGTVD